MTIKKHTGRDWDSLTLALGDDEETAETHFRVVYHEMPCIPGRSVYASAMHNRWYMSPHELRELALGIADLADEWEKEGWSNHK